MHPRIVRCHKGTPAKADLFHTGIHLQSQLFVRLPQRNLAMDWATGPMKASCLQRLAELEHASSHGERLL